MGLSCFEDRSHPPEQKEIKKALGRSSELWLKLIQEISAKFPPISEEWASSSAKSGWSLRLIHKKRRILYLIPQNNSFLAAVVLGEKAVAAANDSSLPQEVLKDLNDAPKYAEGRGIRLTVKSKANLATVKLLVSIKVAN
jgi:hypothetical protein